MNKRGWILPIIIVAINALAIIIRWGSLTEIIPAHFDLQGNAASSMSRNVLLLYPLAGAATCLFAYIVARIKNKLQTGMIVLASGFCLVLLSSTLVSLTAGTVPFFMLDEPVILLFSVSGFILSLLRDNKVKNHTN